MKLYLKKRNSGLYTSDNVNDELLASLENGEYEFEVTKKRNIKFHRKYMSLLRLAFNLWDVDDNQYKNFDVFREGIAELSGFYTQTYNIHGQLMRRGQSISFSAMEEVEFSKLYSRTIDIVLKYILTNYTKDDLEQVIAEILGYD